MKEKTLSADDLVNPFNLINDHGVQAKAKQLGSEINAEKGNERVVEYLEGLI